MSRILVDSSIWIEFFRRPSAPVSLVLDRLLAHRLVCTTGVIKAEVVPGARTPKDFRRLKRLFDALPLAPERDGFWTHVTRFQYRLRRNGILDIGIPDLMVATVAIQNRKTLFSADEDFPRMAPFIQLRLFTP
ncbi:MAG: PIN domain-containing protein [candidate division NC10 bacterium]|nr:PIN domain-containing protein [candidate division NC10 bacterium]MBI2562414.1 PIN domain-containing protein [candidate division NC10 bacterium]